MKNIVCSPPLVIVSLVLPVSFYMFSNYLIFNSSSFLSFWIFMEINIILFVVSIYAFGNMNEDFSSQYIYYFILNSFFSLVFLIASIVSTTISIFRDFMIIISLFFKLGLYPFYYWVINLGQHTSSFFFFFLMSFQKLYLLCFSFNYLSGWLFQFFFVSSFFASIYLFKRDTTIDLLVYSSIYTRVWFLLADYCGSYIFLIYFFLFYRLFLISFLFSSSFKDHRIGLFLIVFCAMFLFGLPPINFFFLKLFSVLFTFLIGVSYSIFVTFWVIVFTSLVGYYSFLYIYFYSEGSIRHTLTFSFTYYLLIMFFSSFLFFL